LRVSADRRCRGADDTTAANAEHHQAFARWAVAQYQLVLPARCVNSKRRHRLRQHSSAVLVTAALRAHSEPLAFGPCVGMYDGEVRLAAPRAHHRPESTESLSVGRDHRGVGEPLRDCVAERERLAPGTGQHPVDILLAHSSPSPSLRASSAAREAAWAWV